MPQIHIERLTDPAPERYVARVDGIDGEAELTLTRKSRQLITADHTNAPDAMRGTGAAKALVERMVADARAEGVKIIPVCPYVRAQSERHPDWSDVMLA